jgi:DNA ligase (NAD+)
MENIKFLEDKYLKAKIAYYEGDDKRKNDLLSDAEFDEIEKTLRERGSKVIEQVGHKRKDFDFSHPTKMLSLSKIQTELNSDGTTNYMIQEFMNWYQKRSEKVGKYDLFGSPKFDGNAINIIYRGTQLLNVLTRGDGISGKSVLGRFDPYLPKNLKVSNLEISENDILEIRAEVVINKELFNSKYRGTREEGKFVNARNYVAGVIGKDEHDEIKMSELRILPLHFLINGKHVSPEYITDNPIYHSFHGVVTTAKDYLDLFKAIESGRDTFDYLLDGVVFSFPCEVREKLGENDHDPEWAIAIKFIPEETITGYRGIEWNVSKRGEIIPTILLAPVFLDGSTVSRASGYNASYILKNNIGPGAKLSIAKAGDIIPEVQKVTVPSLEKVSLPTICPKCSTKLEYDSVHLSCPNEKCEGRIAKQLTGALKTLDIKRVGEKTIEPFAKDFENMFELIKWVYSVGHTPLIEKYGIAQGSRSQEIFINAFKNIKSLTYEQVIQMLGYDNVGRKISSQLAREHAGLDYDYAHLEKALVAKLRSPEISNYIKEVVKGLENLGIKIDKPEAPKGEIIGVCMTGSPKTFGFATKKDFLSANPTFIEASLSDPNCKYLVTDSLTSTSSKMKTAAKKGIEIKTYGDF